MKKTIPSVLLIWGGLTVGGLVMADVEPTWESMAEHYQVPDWFVNGKLGIWFHWGIPSSIDAGRPHDGSHYGAWMYGTEGQLSASKHPEAVQRLTDWHNQHYGHYSKFGYENMIPRFKAEKWDPDGLVKLVKDVGAHFIMPVACHHDNFDMYDSSHPWNSVDMGPRRDTLKEWKAAARKHGLKFGVSTHLYWSPRFFNSARKCQKEGTPAWKLFNVDYPPKSYSSDDAWNEHWYARCWEIIEKYDPDMFNNDSPYPNITSGRGLGIKLFSAFVDKDLKENNGRQDVVLSFKDAKRDRKAFTYNMERGSAAEIEPEPWMWATDLSGTWFYRDGAVNRMSIPVMIGNALDSISKNGVVMLNIALKGDGTIPDNQMKYLDAFRELFHVNGEGIYDSRPWKVFGEGPLVIKAGRGSENHKAWCQQDIRFTKKNGNLHAFVLAPPTEDIVINTLAESGVYGGAIETVTLLGSDEKVTWSRTARALTIQRPKSLPGRHVIAFRIEGDDKAQASASKAASANAQADSIANGGFSEDKVSSLNNNVWMERSHAGVGWVSPQAGGWTVSDGAARSSAQLLGQVNRVTALKGSALRVSFDWTPSAEATGPDLNIKYRVVGWCSDKGGADTDDFGRLNPSPVFNGLTRKAVGIDLLTGLAVDGYNDVTAGTAQAVAGAMQTVKVDLELGEYGEPANELSNYNYLGLFFQGCGGKPGRLDNVSVVGEGSSDDRNYAEDPNAMQQKAPPKQSRVRPWEGRTPEELRAWAKKNLHHKLTAKKVIDAEAHPEWAWFRKSGLGLFLHWGLPSANPNTGDAWAVIWSKQKANHKRHMEPAEKMFSVAETWNPKKYDPDKWLTAAKLAGFGYSVLTTRHHDGYALWPSKHGTWDTGEHMGGRDLVKDYVEASRKNGLRIGFYYSGPNWHFDYKNREFGFPPNKDFAVNHEHERVDRSTKLIPAMTSAGAEQDEESKGQVRELMSNYGRIDVIWWDGNVAMQEEELRPMQPDVFVARGNIATPEGSHQGADNNVKVTNEAGWWWESCQKSESSFTPNWHYGVECESNHWDTGRLLSELVRCRSLGGNLLVNVPPRGDGEMMPWFYEVCNEMAGWMKHSREAVYDVDLDAPLPTLDKTDNYTTVKGNTWYAMPDDKNSVLIRDVESPVSVTLLRTGEALEFDFHDGVLHADVPAVMRTDLPDMVKIVF
jgi:alpha-L-fucosidase